VDIATFPDGRQQLQVPFLMLVSAYIATQLGALIYMSRNEKKDQGYYIGEHDKDEEEMKEDSMNCD
jgi:hypothetical protein